MNTIARKSLTKTALKIAKEKREKNKLKEQTQQVCFSSDTFQELHKTSSIKRIQ